MALNPVYEPDDDSFLLWNVFLKELHNLMDDNHKTLKTFVSEKSFLDMGAGSGYLGFEAGKLGFKNVVFSDINPESISQINSVIESEDFNFVVRESDLFSNVEGFFDFILFNTPYLPNEKSEELNDLALNGGSIGNEVAISFLKQLKNHLSKNGFSLLLTSSLSRPEDFVGQAKSLGFECVLVGSKKLFFEELLVYKLTL